MLAKIFKKLVVIMAASVISAGAFVLEAAANSTVTYGTGTIEVDNVNDNVTTFNAYLIFNATKNPDGSLSNFTWPDNSVRDAVVSAIRQFDSGYTSSSAQDAAEYISEAYTNASGLLTTDQTTILENAELLNKIANAVDGTSVMATLTAGVQTSLAEGYWLIVTDSSSIGVNESGTSPVYAISGGGSVTITEKTTVPRLVAKEVLNDADNASYSHGVDIERGQEVDYRITGTVAGNISTFATYYYEFSDTMSPGIDYVLSSYKVTIDGKDVTGSFTQTYSVNMDGTHTLSVACNDIKSIQGVSVNADSRIVMTYKVTLNDNCVIGEDGNSNTAHIVYSSNPNTNEKSTTLPDITYLYTFELHLEKKDRDTNEALGGAKFTIEATSPDDSASTGLFVQANGTLGSSAYEFTTGNDGSFNISGLDAGTYTLHETKAPDEYQYVNQDTIFTIGASYNESGMITSLTNTVSGNSDAAAGIDNTLDIDANNNAANIVRGEADTGSSAENGLVNVTVGNVKMIKMPLSGREGIWMMVGIGGGLIAVSAAAFLLIRRKINAGSR